MPHLIEDDFNKFNSLCKKLKNNGNAFGKSVRNDKGELLAIALFLKDNKRIYNLMPTTFNDGRKQMAMHYLLDSLFKEFAGQNLIFDFEGSDLPGVKAFYLQFGSINEPYNLWHFNKLIWPLNLIKK